MRFMRYADLLLKTNTEAKEFDSINATLLQKGGFVNQTMAGVYTYLPLGWRVLSKIENIVREEMDKFGSEMLMPALSPKSLWQQTDRLDSIDVLFEARGGNEASKARNDATYILNSTHEELITPIAQTTKFSYKDLPFGVYQIQTKFRNEERPKSGLLRGREFRMKDLYSFHANEQDFEDFYERIKKGYSETFEKLGLGEDTHVVTAAGGAFTSEYTHEFQTVCETGEDTIYLDEKSGEYWNEEVVSDEIKEQGKSFKASEVGNIFPLGTKYSEAFGYVFTDERGVQMPVIMGSYGIGTSRVMGVMVEKFHDEAGIAWPEQVAPFTVYLVALNTDNREIRGKAEAAARELEERGVDVLLDDRQDVGPGAKFADAELIGCPWRVVVSAKTGDEIEIRRRGEQEERLIGFDDFVEDIL